MTTTTRIVAWYGRVVHAYDGAKPGQFAGRCPTVIARCGTKVVRASTPAITGKTDTVECKRCAK